MAYGFMACPVEYAKRNPKGFSTGVFWSALDGWPRGFRQKTERGIVLGAVSEASATSPKSLVYRYCCGLPMLDLSEVCGKPREDGKGSKLDHDPLGRGKTEQTGPHEAPTVGDKRAGTAVTTYCVKLSTALPPYIVPSLPRGIKLRFARRAFHRACPARGNL